MTTKSYLSISQWELVNQAELELCRDTFNPFRVRYGNPQVMKSKDRLNAMLRSYAVHFPEWSSDSLRKMFRMPDQSAFSVDNEDPSGVRIPSVKRLPYLNLLGREFTVTGREAGAATLVKKNQVSLPHEAQILCLRRIRNKIGQATLPRYPFRLLSKMESQLQRHLFRPAHTRVMVEGIHPDKAVQISGCCLCRKLCDKETGHITAAAPCSRVCFDVSHARTWFEILY